MFTQLLLLVPSVRASKHMASAFDHSDTRGSEPHILVRPEPASRSLRASWAHSASEDLSGASRPLGPTLLYAAIRSVMSPQTKPESAR